MSTIQGKTVLITGGASGIGRLMGEILLKEGAKKLVIWDINAESLALVESEFANQGFSVATYQVDVSDTSRVTETYQALKSTHGTVDILINNAGIIVGKPFIEHTHADIDRTMQINSSALMHLTREALPGMLEQRSGHIVNIASAAGLVANPQMSVYCGSKWAVIGWSESLRLELVQRRTGVNVTTVTPYYIDTGMFKGVTSPFIPILKPKPTALKIVKAIKNDRRFVRMPFIINFLPLIKGILPSSLFDLIVGKWLKVYSTMDKFTGRK